MSAPPAAAAHDDWPENYGTATAWWAVAVAIIFQIVSLIDRQIVSVLIPEMRADLALNDFQISMVQGMAFAIFYGGVGLLIGGMVDRHSRRHIMLGGVLIWSLAAAATGLSRTYMHLFFGRLMVGFGEGAISPAAQSLLSSIFPRRKLSTPMSCFTAAGVIGIALSYALGGNLLQIFTSDPLGGPLAGLAPWRQVLIVTGLPGVFVAFLALTIREPVRKRPAATASHSDWGAFFRYILQNKRLFLGVIVGTGMTAASTQAAMVWTPTYARRVLGASAAEIGTMMSIAVASGGIVGGIALGVLIDRLFSRGMRDVAFRVIVPVALFVPPVISIGYLMDDIRLLFASVLFMMLTMGAIYGPTLAAVQMIAPPDMRGRFAALAVLSSNLFGFALGPMAVGAITDYGFADPAKVGVSIAVFLMVTGPLSAWMIWSARHDFVRRLDG